MLHKYQQFLNEALDVEADEQREYRYIVAQTQDPRKKHLYSIPYIRKVAETCTVYPVVVREIIKDLFTRALKGNHPLKQLDASNLSPAGQKVVEELLNMLPTNKMVFGRYFGARLLKCFPLITTFTPEDKELLATAEADVKEWIKSAKVKAMTNPLALGVMKVFRFYIFNFNTVLQALQDQYNYYFEAKRAEKSVEEFLIENGLTIGAYNIRKDIGGIDITATKNGKTYRVQVKNTPRATLETYHGQPMLNTHSSYIDLKPKAVGQPSPEFDSLILVTADKLLVFAEVTSLTFATNNQHQIVVVCPNYTPARNERPLKLSANMNIVPDVDRVLRPQNP